MSMNNIFNIKPYMTFLGRNKWYTLITVFGFSVSLMFVILIGLYTQQEYNVDRWHSRAGRICKLVTLTADSTYIGGSHRIIGRDLVKAYPEFDMECAVHTESKILTAKPNGEYVKLNYLFAEPDFFYFFDFGLLSGNRKQALANDGDAVISQSAAIQLFDDADPVGKTITFCDSIKLHVTGVCKDFAATGFKKPDIIANFETLRHFDEAYTMNEVAVFGGTEVFLMAKSGTDFKAREKGVTDFLRKHYMFYDNPQTGKATALLVPLKDAYMNKNESSNMDVCNTDMVHILLLVGLVVLVFAIINYVNLTVAQSSKRVREMAARRLFGASRKEITLRLIAESVALCLASLLIAVALSCAFAPMVGQMLGSGIDVAGLFRPINLCFVVAFVLIVGITAGLLPAAAISRAQPADVFKGAWRHRSRMALSRLLITFQCFVTMVMVSASLTILFQLCHMIDAPLGYDRDNVVSVSIRQDSIKANTFKNELMKLPGVKQTSLCLCSPLDFNFYYPAMIDGRQVMVQLDFCDRNYMKLLGIKVKKDYNTGLTRGVYVNDKLMEAFKLTPKDRRVRLMGDIDYEGNISYPILGVYNNFFHGSITEGWRNEKPAAIVVDMYKSHMEYYQNILVKIDGDPKTVYEQIGQVYRKVYKEKLNEERPFLDQKVQEYYEKETQLSKIVGLFSFIAVVISIMGLVAMCAYFISQKAKETAIRKVFGSTGLQVRVRLIRTFMAYVAVAFVFAAPTAWYFMSDWLSNYSYRISPWPGILLGGVFCFLVSLAAVYVQCRNASNENPVLRIKDNG